MNAGLKSHSDFWRIEELFFQSDAVIGKDEQIDSFIEQKVGVSEID